ncbi:MAG: phosphatidylserine decarboxylase [Methanosarcinales archaeon Met12]|nr:MAG: phosphatidylserine decarboxylase [Methanosarcinales archaeon Met12]
MLARGSANWILVPLMMGVVAILFESYVVAAAFICLAAFFVVFFRDPERAPRGDGMVSPADGVVMHADKKVGIFMNIYDVHVNRAPLSGVVKRIEYRKGGCVPAFHKDSDRNEQNNITIETEYGDVKVTQIAGILARRIVCYVNEGDMVERGQRIGMIRFGSRVDVTIPDEFVVSVSPGDRVKAGESMIARRPK